jgi:hypothetical protein
MNSMKSLPTLVQRPRPRASSRGFTFTLAALFIALVLIMSCSALQAVPASTTARSYTDPSVRSQAMSSLLFGAAEAAALSGSASSAAAYISAVLSYQSIASAVGTPPGGTGSGYSPPATSLPGSFVKVTNGTGSGSTITVTGVPSGGVVVVADSKFAIIATGTSSGSSLVLNTPASVPQGWVIVYTQDSPLWSYSGTVSPSYKYTFNQDFTVTASSWSPPTGFQQVLVYGAPQLSLIQIYQGTTLKASAVKDLSSQYTVLTPAGTPFTGQINTTGAAAWINTDIKSGDVYAYTP